MAGIKVQRKPVQDIAGQVFTQPPKVEGKPEVKQGKAGQGVTQPPKVDKSEGIIDGGTPLLGDDFQRSTPVGNEGQSSVPPKNRDYYEKKVKTARHEIYELEAKANPKDNWHISATYKKYEDRLSNFYDKQKLMTYLQNGGEKNEYPYLGHDALKLNNNEIDKLFKKGGVFIDENGNPRNNERFLDIINYMYAMTSTSAEIVHKDKRTPLGQIDAKCRNARGEYIVDPEASPKLMKQLVQYYTSDNVGRLLSKNRSIKEYNRSWIYPSTLQIFSIVEHK